VARRALVSAVVLVALLAASATAEAFWFQTPSKAIACTGDAKSIRCDTRFHTRFMSPAYKPKGCDVDWGPLVMGPRTRAHVACVGDTALNPKAKVLHYGQSKLFGPFRCTSRTSGLRCQNRAGHGWFLSRQKQSRF
jgi:hypothetical protein